MISVITLTYYNLHEYYSYIINPTVSQVISHSTYLIPVELCFFNNNLPRSHQLGIFEHVATARTQVCLLDGQFSLGLTHCLTCLVCGLTHTLGSGGRLRGSLDGELNC